MHGSQAAAWLFALCLLSFALAGCATAPQLLLADGGGRLDRAEIERAAAPLLGRGATVAVLVEGEGDTGARFARHLDAAGLLRGGEIAPEAIGVYISYAPRYSELRVGARWSGAVPPAELEAIRQGLNDALRADDPTGGAAAALGAIDGRIGAPWWAALTPGALAIGGGVALALGAPLLLWYRAKRQRRRAWDQEQYAQRIAGLRDSLIFELESLAGKASSAAERAKKKDRRAALRGELTTLRGDLERLRRLEVTPASYQSFLRQQQALASQYRRIIGQAPAGRAQHAAAGSAGSVAGGSAYESSSTSDYDYGSSSSSYDSGSSSSSSDSGGESRAGGDW